MKTKFKYVTLMAAALLVGFTSCSNDEDGGKPGNTAPKSMSLKITRDTPSTYAEGPVQGATQVVFTTGTLYFTDNAGAIKGIKTIGASGVADIDITVVTGASGAVINNVDGSVTKVYIVGNTPALSPVPTTISQVETALLQVQSQGTISNVNLFGMGTLPSTPTTVGTPGVSNDLYAVSLTLKPTVARVELTDMAVSGTYITGYKVAGIFVDNYYSQAAVNGSVAALPSTDLKDNSVLNTPALANAGFADGSTQYPNTPATSSLKGSIYDWYTTPLVAAGSPLKVAPATAGQVWGYNVFASAAGSAVPRIVIRLKDVTTSSDAGLGSPVYSTDQYITVKGLKNGASLLTAIKSGEVYNITGLVFNEQNLSITPNLASIDVQVTVTVVDWVPVAVTPQL